MAQESCILTESDGVATLTMNRPEILNALTGKDFTELVKKLHEAGKSKDAKVLIITGAGKGFCSGAYVKDLVDMDRLEPKAIENAVSVAQQATLAIRNLEKPVIGAINGVAAGGGADLAWACDIRIASEEARFSEVFVKRGLVPDLGGSFFLPRLVGLGKAFELIYTGNVITAQEAERLGLVNKVVPHDQLSSFTFEFARELAKGPAVAYRNAKIALNRSLYNDLENQLKMEATLQSECLRTEDCKESARAFLEKRPPRFKGY